MILSPEKRDWSRFESIDIEAAAVRIAGVLQHTPLRALPCADERIELRVKLENRQATGAFKARGALNQILQLSAEQRAAGVVTCSSGNHGKALAWAAKRAGVAATIVMPSNAYLNKISACQNLGARVVLSIDPEQADVEAAQLAAKGLALIHPYDAECTVEGAGTVGLEIAADWPDVEVVVVPVGGGGLISGCSLALRRALGNDLHIFGVEPVGAASMTRGLQAGKQVQLEAITTGVQGLCPMNSGALNIAICLETIDAMFSAEDAQIFAAQAELVRAGETVEPAGAAALVVILERLLPARLFAGRGPDNRLRVAAVVSGGNADPEQIARLREEG